MSPAQTSPAAAASLIGPATSLSCMPSPLLPSLITMIGRSFVKATFERDLRSPRQAARKPGSELAPPTSTPNSVRWTASLDAGAAVSASVSSSAGGIEADTSGTGAAVAFFGGGLGSINFPAAGSGGAIIDFDATSGVVGVAAGTAGAFEAACALADAGAGPGSAAMATPGGFSAAAAVVAVTGETTGAGDGFCAVAGGSAD